MSANEIRNAAVTGAGGGIGRAIALALLGEGMLVWLIGRDQDKLEPVAKQGHRRARADHRRSCHFRWCFQGRDGAGTATGRPCSQCRRQASAVIGHRSALTNGRRSSA